MAQKLGLALIALFGLVECEIASLRGTSYSLIDITPVARHDSHTAEDDDEEAHSGPKLGGRDPKLGISVVNFASKSDNFDHYDSFGQIVRPSRGSDDHRVSSHGRSDRSEGRSHRQEEGESEDHSDDRRGKSQGWKGLGSRHDDRHEQDHSERNSHDDHDDHSHDHSHSDDRPVRVVVAQAVKTITLNHVEERHEEHSDEKPTQKVAIPVFSDLHYVDTDTHGESTKAPITIVTAPLISTAETERHKVPVNQVLGRSNCPECIEENKEAAETKRAATKALQRDDNLLKTKIQGPIKDVKVAIVENHSSSSREEEHSRGGHRDHDDHSDREGEYRHKSRYSGEDLDQRAVYKSLAIGEARENAPFLVKSVVIAPEGNLRSEDHEDDHRRRDHN